MIIELLDLTFSAPKSVSIMAEVFENQDVLQAHLDAVKDTISAIEDHYTQTRISVDGTIQKSESDNLVVALLITILVEHWIRKLIHMQFVYEHDFK